MNRFASLSLLLVTASILCAQDSTAPKAQDSTAPKAQESTALKAEEAAAPKLRVSPAYVRRFTVGGSVDLLGGLNVIRSGSWSAPYGTNSQLNSVTHGAYQYVSGGLTMQFAILNRVSLNANVLYRRAAYNNTTDFGGGVAADGTVTQSTVIHEYTRAVFWEVPVLARVYNKKRHQPGRRWFYEGGGTVRSLFNIRSDRDITDPQGKVTYNYTPATSAKRTIYGVVGGAGFQIIDPVGVRIIPEVRYTRWLDVNFNAYPTRSNRNQVEFVFSLTF